MPRKVPAVEGEAAALLEVGLALAEAPAAEVCRAPEVPEEEKGSGAAVACRVAVLAQVALVEVVQEEERGPAAPEEVGRAALFRWEFLGVEAAVRALAPAEDMVPREAALLEAAGAPEVAEVPVVAEEPEAAAGRAARAPVVERGVALARADQPVVVPAAVVEDLERVLAEAGPGQAGAAD